MNQPNLLDRDRTALVIVDVQERLMPVIDSGKDVVESCQKLIEGARLLGVPVIVTAPGTDLYNPNTIRASLGAIFQAPVYAASAEETRAWLRSQQLPIFAARLQDAVDYTAADFSHGAAIVLGSEAAGLSPAWQTAEVTGIRLPMLGIADSLNVSATAAVLLFEARRQRGGTGDG